jgi:hypothetical protein
MPDALPVRLSVDGSTATWNPALTRASHVILQVRRGDGTLDQRRSLNSGRARVLAPERIEAVVAGEE